ncbi:MAG: hypothetical protein JRH20_16800 [Deltaproteobacteria bacterium]|nr:hypothetical protein [Deltaproteobacteria bacterium]
MTLKPLQRREHRLRHNLDVHLPDTVKDIPFSAKRYSLVGFKEPFDGFRKPPPSTLWHTEVSFGKLNAKQFSRLRRAYGNHTDGAFSPRRDYALIDFLPKHLRDLVGKQLIAEPIAVNRSVDPSLFMNTKIRLGTNCHATAYLGLRSFHTHTSKNVTPLFFIDPLIADYEFGRLKFLKTESLAAEHLDPRSHRAERNKGRKVGDIVQFYRPLEPAGKEQPMGGEAPALMHSMIWIGPDLFLHQADTGYPWAVTQWKQALGQARALTGGWRMPRVVTRAVVAGARVPPPKKLFSLKKNDSYVFEQLKALDKDLAHRLNSIAVQEFETGSTGGMLNYLSGARWD